MVPKRLAANSHEKNLTSMSFCLPSISIAVPCWGYKGKGVYFLNQLFESILSQSYLPSEVVISDHSHDDLIFNFCKTSFYASRLNIKYIRCTLKRGNSPYNTNNAISHCTSDIIKILFQDDYFIDNSALLKIATIFASNSQSHWVVNGSTDIDKTNECCMASRLPLFSHNLLVGINTIGSPSTLSFRRLSKNILFDDSLVMLMDTEYYYRLFLIFGPPVTVNYLLIANSIHDRQISSTNKSLIFREKLYCIRKFIFSNPFSFYILFLVFFGYIARKFRYFASAS